MKLKKLRILLVLTPAFDPNDGGVQMSTWKMSKFFASKGHRVGVYSFTGVGHKQQDFAQLFCDAEVEQHRSVTHCDALEKTLATFRPDVVINQMPYEHAIGSTLRRKKNYALLGCLRNTLYSVTANLDQYGQRLLPRIIAPLFRNRFGRSSLLAIHKRRHRAELQEILRTYDCFVMFGPPNIDELQFFLPNFDRRKIRLIPNSIPTVLDGLPAKENRILWLGRLNVEQKRADLIVPLWEKISQSLPNWHFDVVGDGPSLEEVQQDAIEIGLKNIVFHGRQVPDDYFKRSSIFVMTSAFEGFPNVLLEAQSFGAIPVIFDSYPIASWIVSDEVDGFLVEPFDLDAMACQIIRVAQGSEMPAIMTHALENARRFHIETVGQKWLELFDECIEKRQSASEKHQ